MRIDGGSGGYGAGIQSASGAVEKTQSPAGPDSGQEQVESLREMLQEAREKAEERRESLKVRKSGTQYGDAAMMAYARLARAKSQGEVSAAAGYARRRIAQFQAALGSDSENSERIRAAIRQLQKAVGRAGKKKRELQREDLVRARQRRAQLEKQRRKAAGLNQELNRRRSMRMIREAGYLRETEIDNRLQDQLAQTRMELRAQAQELSAALGPSVEGAMREYAVQAGELSSAPPAEVDIQA